MQVVAAIDLDNQPEPALGGGARFSNQDPVTGWCNFTGSIPNMAQQQPVLYVSSSGNALIDDGVILPADGTNSFTRTQITLDSRTRERVRFIGDWVRTHRKF